MHLLYGGQGLLQDNTTLCLQAGEDSWALGFTDSVKREGMERLYQPWQGVL